MMQLKIFCCVVCLLLFVMVPVEASESQGDGDFTYIEHTDTKRTEEASCQVSVKAECPEGFGLNAYVVISDEEGKMYRVSLSEENGYEDHVFLRDGHYNVVEAKVYNDNTGRYPFEQVGGAQDFDITNGETANLHFRLRDYEKIDSVIADGRGKRKVEDEFSSENRYRTAIKGVEINAIGELLYRVEKSGSDIGELKISGNARGDYDVVVSIIKTGVIGEARFSLSLDGGDTIVGDDVTAEKFPLKDYGLVLYFSTDNDGDELQEGDVFCATIPETFMTDSARYGEDNVIIAGHPKKDHAFEVNVLSPGGRSESKFTVSMDGGNSIAYTDTMPRDGRYEVGDGLVILFSDSSGFEKGQVFTAEVKSNYDRVSMVPVYVLAGIISVVGMAFYGFLVSKKERLADYTLHKWKDLQDESAYR